MDWFWNWGGECFGYRDGESLFTYFGKEAGRFDGERIYGSDGRYPNPSSSCPTKLAARAYRKLSGPVADIVAVTSIRAACSRRCVWAAHTRNQRRVLCLYSGACLPVISAVSRLPGCTTNLPARLPPVSWNWCGLKERFRKRRS